METHRSRPTSATRVVVAAAVLFVSMLGFVACGGNSGTSDAEGSASGDTAPADRAHEPDASNCPVDALDQADGPIEIDLWHSYFVLSQKALQDIVDSYNASQTRVKVNLEYQGTPVELQKKYEDRLGDPSRLPDAVFVTHNAVRAMIDSESVVPVVDCIEADPASSEFYEDLVPVLRDTYSVAGTLWPSAFGVSLPIVYVNQLILDRAGIADGLAVETLDDLRAVAEKIRESDVPGLERSMVVQLDGSYWESWITGAGETIVDESNGHDGLARNSTIDNGAALAGLEWLRSMQADGLLKAYPDASNMEHVFAIGNRSAAILIEGSMGITTVHAVVEGASGGISEAEGVDPSDMAGIVGKVKMLPGLEEAGQGTTTGTAGFMVAGTDPARIAAAWDFMRYFNSMEAQVVWTTKGSSLPATGAVREAAEVQDFFTNDGGGQLLAVIDEQLLGSDPGRLMPVFGPYDWFSENVNSMMNRVVLQGGDPSEELSRLHTEFQQELERYERDVTG